MSIPFATATMGALKRSAFRRYLNAHGIAYREDRGWIDSQFVIPHGDKRTFELLAAWKRLASGMSTGTAKTPKAVEGRSSASPVANGETPPPSDLSTDKDG